MCSALFCSVPSELINKRTREKLFDIWKTFMEIFLLFENACREIVRNIENDTCRDGRLIIWEVS